MLKKILLLVIFTVMTPLKSAEDFNLDLFDLPNVDVAGVDFSAFRNDSVLSMGGVGEDLDLASSANMMQGLEGMDNLLTAGLQGEHISPFLSSGYISPADLAAMQASSAESQSGESQPVVAPSVVVKIKKPRQQRGLSVQGGKDRKERNRCAAQRSRDKKKEEVRQLEEQEARLAIERARLETQLGQLEAEQGAVKQEIRALMEQLIAQLPGEYQAEERLQMSAHQAFQ